jgi:hypothetical protein
MIKRCLLTVSLLASFACSPVSDDPTPGTGGSGGSAGGSGGSSGGRGGSTAGSGGSNAGTGGATGGSGGAAGGTGGAPGGSGGTGGATGGSGGATGGSGGSTGGSGGGTTDGGTPDSGGEGDAPPSTGTGPAAALHDQVIRVPCPNQTGMGASCSVATNVRAYDKPFMITGNPATTYKVKVKICAVYEGRPYTGCMTSPDSPRICINGTPGTGSFAPTYPSLGIKVADPMRTYYLNNGTDWPDDILKFDYTATIEVKGGTMINVISDGGNNGGVYTPYQKNRRHTCPNVPGMMGTTPYLGQFIHFQVVSTDPMN